MKIKQRIISALAAAAMALSTLSTTSFASSSRFDVNGDGFVTARDAYYVLTEVVINDNTDPKLDVNKDGFVNAKDAYYLLLVVMEIIVPEPEETEPETPAAESILDDYTKKWAYNTLSKSNQQAYADIFNGALNNQATISLRNTNMTESDLKKVFWACDYDNPLLLNIDGGYYYSYSSRNGWSISINYGKTASQTTQALKKVEETTADVIAEAKKLSSDYDRVKLFHDWIINRTEYVSTGNKYISETDGPILHGEALCEGYSRAFEYLCQSIGIECVCIAGTATSSVASGNHMWNMVKVDGKWYHIDVTWDDPISTSGKPVLRYDYFLISDAQIRKDHTINNAFTVPTAPSNYTA